MIEVESKRAARRVVVLALPGTVSLDAFGPLEVFHAAARFLAMRSLRPPVDPTDDVFFVGSEFAYDVALVGARAGNVDTTSGVRIAVEAALASVTEPIDTLIVSGGNVRRMMQTIGEQPELLDELRRVAGLARRVASVCTGSFLLAAAGLLDGKRATTHWGACDILQNAFPKIQVERDPIYTVDGKVYTSAGVCAGMDLSLALVRDDHGLELANEVARWFVLYVERSAGQAQLSAPLRMQAEREPIRELLRWVVDHPDQDLTVEALAARVHMSVRNFTRAFRKEVSTTPAAYVAEVRVEAARRRLELGRAPLEQIAVDVGFGSVQSLRRAFVRSTGQSPSACRSARKNALE